MYYDALYENNKNLMAYLTNASRDSFAGFLAILILVSVYSQLCLYVIVLLAARFNLISCEK